jgi:putative endonuclease
VPEFAGTTEEAMKGGWVYMTANRYRGTIYTGVTSNLARRMWLHRNGKGSIFAAEHKAFRLVWAEEHSDICEAIVREKRIKKWLRDWKIDLIEQSNPEWNDLYDVML